MERQKKYLSTPLLSYFLSFKLCALWQEKNSRTYFLISISFISIFTLTKKRNIFSSHINVLLYHIDQVIILHLSVFH